MTCVSSGGRPSKGVDADEEAEASMGGVGRATVTGGLGPVGLVVGFAGGVALSVGMLGRSDVGVVGIPDEGGFELVVELEGPAEEGGLEDDVPFSLS